MPPVVIDIRSADDSRDVVHRAVQALVEGQLVAFPTETVYGIGASALCERGVERLAQLKQRSQTAPFALVVKSVEDALDYVPHMSCLGQRLARRCWPGPVTLVLDDSHPDSLLTQLPESVRARVCPTQTVGLRIPAHQTILDCLQMMAGPIALTSANRHGQAEAVTAQEVVAALGDEVHLVLDDGRSRFGQPSSVVRVHENNRFEILRAGVVSEQTLKRLASFMLLFVCTGNTCRSPMAEALARHLLAKKLGCTADQLADRGVVVMSAGVSAMLGAGPSAEAVEVLREQQIDLRDHVSQPVSDQLVRHADLICTMTAGHRQALLHEWPAAADRVRLLCHDQSDIGDPIGGPTELYRRCAQQIQAELEQLLSGLEI